MQFEPMALDEIQTYLRVIGDGAEAISVILTDGTMLTGQYTIQDDPFQPLSLNAFWGTSFYNVKIPAYRIAGILEQSPLGARTPDPALLVLPAARAGLYVDETTIFGIREPGGVWIQAETIQYRQKNMLYFDAPAIRARSGGINNIGGGFVFSASIGWNSKLVGKARGLLRRHVVEIGSHCAAPHADQTLIGYVEFFDVSDVQPSSEGGPLLELEGALWSAAIVWRAPRGSRHLDGRWALCYFRQDRMSLGPRNWERIGQPVRVYGDRQPKQQELPDLGVAQCQLMARASACFPKDKLFSRVFT